MAVKTGMDTSQTSAPRQRIDDAALLRYMRAVRSSFRSPLGNTSPFSFLSLVLLLDDDDARASEDKIVVGVVRVLFDFPPNVTPACVEPLQREIKEQRAHLERVSSSRALTCAPSPRAVPHFPTDVASLRVTQFGHGQSNPTYKVECLLSLHDDHHHHLHRDDDDVRATYVLRKKPPGKILASAHAVEREFAVQRALGAARAVPVPEMLALCEDPAVLGTPFYLMTFVPGHIFVAPGLPDVPTPAHRAAVYDEMARVLGAIHRVDPTSVGLDGYGKPVDYSRRQLERWARQYAASVTTPEPPVTALIAWLRANVPAEEPSGRLVHGDFRLDNLVFASSSGPYGTGGGGGGGEGVAAVLDWELSTLGAPYSDIAYNCMPYHLPPGGDGAAYPSFASAALPPGVPSVSDCTRAHVVRTLRRSFFCFCYFRV